MTTSNARKLQNSERRIVMIGRRTKRNDLAAQKLAGVMMLAVVAIGLAIGGDFSAVAVIVPLALAAVFSKEKLLDFRIFSNGGTRNYR